MPVLDDLAAFIRCGYQLDGTIDSCRLCKRAGEPAARIASCGHRLCEECLILWLISSKTCPWPGCNETLYSRITIADKSTMMQWHPVIAHRFRIPCLVRQCAARFDTTAELTQHMAYAENHYRCFHPTRDEVVDGCERLAFASEEERFAHQALEVREHPYVCPFDCGFGDFGCESGLRRHFKRNHLNPRWPRKIQCCICSAMIDTSKSVGPYMRHRAGHAPNPKAPEGPLSPFRCLCCTPPKKFLRSRDRAQHTEEVREKRMADTLSGEGDKHEKRMEGQGDDHKENVHAQGVETGRLVGRIRPRKALGERNGN